MEQVCKYEISFDLLSEAKGELYHVTPAYLV